MTNFPVGIAGLGHAVPDRVLDNDWFTQFLDTSDEWIRQRTGIVERRWLDEDETTSDLFVRAGKIAIERAGLTPEDIDLIVVPADEEGMIARLCRRHSTSDPTSSCSAGSAAIG